MSNLIVNYDGSITTTPKQLLYPQTVQEIQAIILNSSTYPSPVRAKGSYHSLTPCVSSDGTILDMSRMTQIIEIDGTNNIFTAQAGLQFIDASKALREHDLQFITNVEIGNMTLGAASCCHSKDALDGIEFGQVNSYVTRIKWVTPAGELADRQHRQVKELEMFQVPWECVALPSVSLRIPVFLKGRSRVLSRAACFPGCTNREQPAI